MNIDELRAKAKAAGIKSWHVKKPETLEKELTELEPVKAQETQPAQKHNPEAPKLNIIVTEDELKFFKNIGLKPEWIEEIANRYGFDKFQYIAKFKAFRCFKEGKLLDWISINDLSMLHLKTQIVQIPLKHQELPPERQVIKLPWRVSAVIKINDPSLR